MSLPRHRVLAPTLVAVVALVTAACGSDADSDSSGTEFGVGPPPVTETETPTETDTTQPSTTTEPDTTAAPDTTTQGTEPAATSPPTTNPGPLAEPSVALSELGSFDRPVDVAVRPGSAAVFVAEQPGRIVVVTELSAEVVLDISDLTEARGERGLLGLAFHPAEDLAYVNYTDDAGDTVIAEFAVEPTTGQFDRSSFREVLAIDQPFSNHNGGQLAFGPDELLYIGVGDGGSGGDPERFALDLSSPLGKILRIDPVADAAQPFVVPADNPFVDDVAADPTIWAYGLRNPWRFSFDPDTGDLWIGDVGQGDFEEINRSTAGPDGHHAARGANYGWSAFEGFERYNADQPTDGAVAPIFAYDHTNGRCSVTGGTVARGGTVTDLDGWYLFGDYCSGQIWGLDPSAPASEPRVVELAELAGVVAISPGPGGELYAVSNSGTVARLVAG